MMSGCLRQPPLNLGNRKAAAYGQM